MSSRDDRLAGEVRHLYWETEASVAEIADLLGISRRALYDLLAPWPAGAACAACGTGLVFVNRSAQRSGEAVCPACGQTQDLVLLRELTAQAGSALRQEAERREAAGAAGAEASKPREALPAEGLPPGGPASAGALPRPQPAGPPLADEPEVEQLRDAAALAPIHTAQALRRSRWLALGGVALAGAVVGAMAGLLTPRLRGGR